MYGSNPQPRRLLTPVPPSKKRASSLNNHCGTDRRKCAAHAADTIELKLAEGKMQEAWRLLKGWHRLARDMPSKPCHNTMAKQTEERFDLYAKVPPHEDPIPIHCQPFEIKDDVPEESEIRAIVKGLRNGRASEASDMRVELIKQWLHDMVVEDEHGKDRSGTNGGSLWSSSR